MIFLWGKIKKYRAKSKSTKAKSNCIKDSVYIDDGYSGTNFDRPAVQRMLSMCRQGKIDCIVVKDLSRFGRNYLQAGEYLEQVFPSLGIRFIGINDGYDSQDYVGSTGGMDTAFKNFIYELYSRDLSEKVKSGVAACMKRGEYYAGCTVFGYEKTEDGRKIVIDEGASAVIRQIFQEIADGKGADALAKELNVQGVPVRLAYKQAKGEQCGRHYAADIWNRNKIYEIIHNPIYQGDMVYRKTVRAAAAGSRKAGRAEKTQQVISEHHEAVVSRELFQRANEKIRKRKKTEYDRSGMKWGIVFCGCCGNRMELHKTKHPYYVCRRRNLLMESGCNELRVEKQVIEQTVHCVWQEHVRLFHTVPVQQLFEEPRRKLQKQLTVLAQKQERARAERFHLYERFWAGAVNKEVFPQKKEILARQEKKIQEQMQDAEKQLDTQKRKQENYQNILRLHAAGSMEAVFDKFMRQMAAKVIVYGEGRLEIVWRYEDEFYLN